MSFYKRPGFLIWFVHVQLNTMEIGWNVDLCCLIFAVRTLKVSLMKTLYFGCSYNTCADLTFSLLGADQKWCRWKIIGLSTRAIRYFEWIICPFTANISAISFYFTVQFRLSRVMCSNNGALCEYMAFNFILYNSHSVCHTGPYL